MEANNLTEDAIRLAEQSEELKAFFKPSEFNTDYERMVSDAADWAMDNYEAEGVESIKLLHLRTCQPTF